MAAFATVKQLFARLRMPAPASGTEDFLAARGALEDASAEIVRVTGQSLEPGTTTVTERVPVGGVINLPVVPARAITAVVDATTGQPVPHEFENAKQILVHAPARSRVRITYDHGYATIPGDIVRFTCMLAASQILAADAGNLGLSGGLAGIGIDDGRVSFATRAGEQGEGVALPERVERSLRATYGAISATLDHRQ